MARVKRRRKYNSYQGEIPPSVSNAINRGSHAGRPDEKCLADITGSAIPVGNVCLSPTVGCFDGMLPYWTVSTAPDAALVNDTLDGAIPQLGDAEHPIVHTDRGRHYRWPGWISRMGKARLERSMPQKGMPSSQFRLRRAVWPSEKRDVLQPGLGRGKHPGIH